VRRVLRASRAATVVAVAAVALAAGPAALAAAPWTRTDSGVGASTARTLAGGNAPSFTNVNTPAGNVTVNWAPSSLSNGGPGATRYDVQRFDARTGTLANASVCTTAGATTCSESGVPSTGTWTYTVTPRYGGWLGATSPLSGPVNVGTPTPVAGSVVTTNGGTAGKPDQGDTISVRFTQQLRVSSLCSTWSGDSSDQSVSADNVVVVTFVNNGAGSGKDLMTVSTSAAACGGAPTVGSFNLGANYFNGNPTCSGAGAAASTLSWAAATSTLTIRLGGNCTKLKTIATTTIVYTPSGTTVNSTGTVVTGTASSSTGQQF
jgi:hypothetical protein